MHLEMQHEKQRKKRRETSSNCPKRTSWQCIMIEQQPGSSECERTSEEIKHSNDIGE